MKIGIIIIIVKQKGYDNILSRIIVSIRIAIYDNCTHYTYDVVYM